MKISKTPLDGVLLLEPKVFGDSRGFFFELWSQARTEESGLPGQFKQDNISLSAKGILRGLHFQNPNPQGKLVSVLQGSVFDVAVDLRTSSKTFGQWYGVELNAENHLQLYVPPGFAHGFLTLSPNVLFHYKCTEIYTPSNEHSLLWNDADVGIKWPTDEVNLSAKDKVGLKLKEFPKSKLFE